MYVRGCFVHERYIIGGFCRARVTSLSMHRHQLVCGSVLDVWSNPSLRIALVTYHTREDSEWPFVWRLEPRALLTTAWTHAWHLRPCRFGTLRKHTHSHHQPFGIPTSPAPLHSACVQCIIATPLLSSPLTLAALARTDRAACPSVASRSLSAVTTTPSDVAVAPASYIGQPGQIDDLTNQVRRV